ncbi:mesoderm posterior ab [Rhinichthys klamathensis goyatoka]|uniref:mesoderm posterior ab n=1 Tax=Rhinichthys klamathensis goyatoka TaxID=3034132 RepID=UPI0024B57E51|nr:mesoderm posterior ab [Rhinichthys klamathensis goyatoka]
MEFNFSPYMLQGAACQFEYKRSPTSVDAGYFSACGSLSPSSSIDSGCFSPPASCWRAGRHLEAAGEPDIDCIPAKKPRTILPAEGKRRSRSKNPGTKRQTASEREKLRMRDLTKALHHLRNYLPPSVAHTGQTLTKIETLRLTISYISYLSAQLEQTETSNHETSPRCFSQDTSDRLQTETWCLVGPEELMQDNVQNCPTFTAFSDSTQQMENNFPSTSHFRDAQSYKFPCATTHDATYSHQFFQ